MTSAGLRLTAAGGAVATVVGGVAVLGLALSLPALGADDLSKSAATAPFVLGMSVLAGTGWLLVRERPRSRMGWLLLLTGLAGVAARLTLGVAVLADTRAWPVSDLLGWLTNWAWIPAQGLALLLLLRFPDGRLPGSRWRFVETAVIVWSVVAVVVTAVLPGPLGAEQLEPRTNPIGLTALDGVLAGALDLLFVAQPVLVVVVVASAVPRWRRADEQGRRQLLAVLGAMALVAAAAPLALAWHAAEVLEGVTWLVLPVTIAYTVARHGLWDLDVRRRLDRLRGVREEERARLQRDLHDSLGPLLGSIALRVEAARNLTATAAPSGDIDRVLASIGGDAERAVVEARRLIDGLRPAVLAETDLRRALAELVADYADVGLQVTLDVPHDLPPLAAAAEIAVYRVAGEALRNVLRHAGASHCRVSVRVEGDDVVLDVVDDGIGLRGRPAGVGRRSMCERIALVGGDLAVSEPAGGGVHVSARLAEVLR